MSIYTYNIPTGDHIHPLSSKALPYYNAGACYFYGVRTTAIPYQYRIGESEVYHSISVCRFSFDGTARLECRLSVSNENSWGLRKFLDYPLLLEAILNSKIVSKKKRKYINVHGKCSKIMYWDYSLEGITIPDYYTEYIKKADSIRKTAAWNLLDQSLKKAIEARYQQQLIRRERKP